MTIAANNRQTTPDPNAKVTQALLRYAIPLSNGMLYLPMAGILRVLGQMILDGVAEQEATPGQPICRDG